MLLKVIATQRIRLGITTWPRVLVKLATLKQTNNSGLVVIPLTENLNLDLIIQVTHTNAYGRSFLRLLLNACYILISHILFIFASIFKTFYNEQCGMNQE